VIEFLTVYLYLLILAWSLVGTWFVVTGLLGKDFARVVVGTACFLMSFVLRGL